MLSVPLLYPLRGMLTEAWAFVLILKISQLLFKQYLLFVCLFYLVLGVWHKGNNNFFANVFILFFFNIFYEYGGLVELYIKSGIFVANSQITFI